MADRSHTPAGLSADDLAAIVAAAATRSLAGIAPSAGGAGRPLVPASIRLRIALRRLRRRPRAAGGRRDGPAAFLLAASAGDADAVADVLWLAAAPDRPRVTLEERRPAPPDRFSTDRRDRHG